MDASGGSASVYQIEPLLNGVAGNKSAVAQVWSQQYLEFPLKTRNTSIYEINDITTADLDGDGSYELIVKRIAKGWNEDNTNYSYFEAYKLDGTFLWEINVGPNILPDVEINIAAFDFDEDGKAEVFMRSSEGTIFGDGTQIGDTNGDGKTNYRYSVGTTANMQYMNEGPEFLSLIDGETGAELDRVNFIPRGQSSDWGDNYGHRASKFFFGAPYLDGIKPSLFIGRGIYTKTEMRTYDVVNKQLVPRWSFSSGNSGPYYGQGNHNYTIADVDGDGRDEIVWGSMAVDDDGTGLYSTGLGHGDAMHVGDLDPFRKGAEAWRCLENSPHWGTVFHDAGTGEILIHNRTGFDTGRAIAANISDNITGKAMWGGGTMYGATSRNVIPGSGGSENFRIYWDGDLLEELLNHTGFTTTKGYGTGAIYKYGQTQPILLASGAISNNYTKGTPSLQADLFGDWREEVVWRTEDNTAVRIYTTVDPTEHRVYSLMHDHQYRQAIAWQMCGYNQPPHVSFFLGEREGKTVPPPPSTSNRRLVYRGGDWSNGATIWSKEGINVAFADGESILLDASAGVNLSFSLNHEVAPAVMTVNSPNNMVLNAIDGKLGGSMQLIKSGSGSFALNGIHDFSGDTEVWGGLLELEGELINSKVLVEFFGQLGLDGKLGHGLQLRYGAELFVGGVSTSGTSEITGDLILEEGARLKFDVTAETNDVLVVNGDIQLADGAVIEMSLGEGMPLAGTYVLAQLNEGVTFLPEHYEVAGLTGVPYELKQEETQLQLVIREVRSAQTVYWNGVAGGDWNLADAENFRTLENAPTYFVGEDAVVFDDTAPATEVNLTQSVTPASILVNTAGTYRFTGPGAIEGTTGLVKTGTGRLKIENTNAFTGAVDIQEGTIEVASMPNNIGDGALGKASNNAGLLLLNGGTLDITQGGTADRAMTIGAAGGTLQNSGELFWNEAVVGGNLTKIGPGKLILAGHNTHNELIIKEGTVRLLNEETNPGKKVVFEGGVLESYDNSYSYSTWTWNMEVPDGKIGHVYMDGRGDYTGALTGSGALSVYIPFVRTDFRGNWSAFSGTLRFVKSGSGGDFRVDNNFGYPNALVDLGEGVNAYHVSSGTVKLGALRAPAR
ncbi:predicted rhamnogalacturonan lyase in rhamnose utilization cluster [Geofilum rubicundum JCM 15548]|uniref:Predicted rhamnogalacturonan lyase in rhamnose utilization cluster n=2 Tax=Geofilum TaxID=1236988 RepID=A0A0E9LW43_9BACT|nr:predicted rhamnogalacturonan lyase in rhamnose utilization cluster [Geofilum rubicundum JCM 15548]